MYNTCCLLNFLELLGLVLKQGKIKEEKMEIEMENTFAVSQLSC